VLCPLPFPCLYVYDLLDEDELLDGGDEFIYNLEVAFGLCQMVLALLEIDTTESGPPAGS